jgi:DNA-binding response OmpR family regulator
MALLRALIVDGDIATRIEIAAMLSPQEFECVEAKDGVEALQWASDDGIDLVIADLDTPKISGLELIGLIRRGVFGAHPPPVIICATHLVYEAFVIRPEPDFAIHVIHKPVVMADLMEAVELVFSQSRSAAAQASLSRAAGRKKVGEPKASPKSRVVDPEPQS